MTEAYPIVSLVYCFSPSGEALLLRRSRPPNQGLMSPCGGKLKTASGESPHQCAAREVGEELGLAARVEDLRWAGTVSGQGEARYLMFLFELLPRVERLPPPIDEGEFSFVPPRGIMDLPLPRTDREMLWPLFWKHRRGFFMARCRHGRDRDRWTVEQASESPRA